MMQTNKALYTIRIQTAFLFFVLTTLTHTAFSQTPDSAKIINHFGAAVTATNNGISLLPTFTLGKPAVMFDMSVGTKKLSFEPQFRFSMEGKPWSFIFWWRYKLINSNKFQVKIGAHPAIAFRTVPTLLMNGDTHETVVAQRFLAGELAPTYSITEHISIGMYYLHAHGLDEGGTRNTHFLTFNSNFSNIRISEEFYMKFTPQVYYLRMDNRDGYYATATVGLSKRNFPLSIQSIVNQTIKTSIPAKNDFVWNLSLIYAFNKEYVSK